MLIPQSYSRCSGKKKALIIGINYTNHPDPRLKLRGCVNDAHAMARFLHENERFKGADILVLVDNQAESGKTLPTNQPTLPTKSNILEAMAWLVRDAQPDDSLLLYFSGHAKQIKNSDGDDVDGFNECICAMDYRDGGTRLFHHRESSGMISNKDMGDIMVDPLPQRCRLTAIFDCSPSGNLLVLPFVVSGFGS
ncbi:peptidase C14, caspase domain-containing protein [Multifurca ochricompacta]|uniref:Peptidase C14, caspase domain-containing protein n=1 Tax=Multifurca ochricompacta TaxID=376703 RepID=A0AAD4M4C5_9AGAM|nr:peptidase C14, caspase domain-containing protein [Multifurca ochricompacta]